jgi:hypothetical protein
MKNGDTSAYPSIYQSPKYQGLTKREFIAMTVLSGLVANPRLGFDDKTAVDQAIRHTDDLLKELEVK